jgi:hypothetical protein
MSYYGYTRVNEAYDVGVWALGTCGLTSVERASHYTEPRFERTTDEYSLKEVKEACKLADKTYCHSDNIIFAIDSSQLLSPSSMYKPLLEHPHCRIIHHYKNDAHAPNCVFICMLHKDPKTVYLTNHTNNVEAYRKRLYKDGYNYYVKEEEDVPACNVV